MKRSKTAPAAGQILKYGVIAVLVLVPFQATLTTWPGSNFGHLDFFRIWKEIAIALLVPPALWLAVKDADLRHWLKRSWLVRLILIYAALHLILGIAALQGGRVNAVALIYAWLANLRFLAFFLLAVVATAKTDIKRHWPRLLLAPAAVVVAFGLLQRFVLPADFLRHLGYGPRTIPALETVDQKLSYRRVQSTLRGANPLGAYLLVVITALAVQIILPFVKDAKGPTFRKWGLVMTVAGLLVLFLTYSRSAWLGLTLSLGLLVFWSIKSRVLRRWLVVIGCSGVIILGGAVWSLRHNNILENTLFHTDQTSRSATSSNSVRFGALRAGLVSVAREPLGRGPGTAGPASTRNNHPARIAENYYVQIAQEVGVAGLLLFIAINLLAARELWLRRADPLSLILLASLAGLTLINVVSHAWADDTLGLIWWGLAGLALTPRILPGPNAQ